jgi:hypothetical protein
MLAGFIDTLFGIEFALQAGDGIDGGGVEIGGAGGGCEGGE